MATVSQHFVHVGDTLQPLRVTLERPDETPVDLTGKTVTFRAVDETGAVAVAEAAATVTNALTGQVEFDLQASHVATARTIYGYWKVSNGGEFETFPVGSREYEITIYAD